MKYVFLAVFLVSTAVHLYASLKQNTRMRNISKPFILLALLGFYCTAARSVSPFIVLALIFSWIGDVLLIPRGVKWFTAGGIAFMISHAFFVAGYWKDVDFARIPALLLINGTMNCFAIFRAVSLATWPAVVTAIGAALFFVSDSSLFFVRFKKDSRLKTHFLVMLTYSIGEFLIILGLL